jgi:hypothetical protein
MLPGRQAKDINADDVVLGLDAAAIRRSFVEKLSKSKRAAFAALFHPVSCRATNS